MAEVIDDRVGFIGLGNMGSQMVRRSLAAGFEVTIHDIRRTAAHEELLELGAKWCGTAAGLAAQCEVIVSCLPTSQTVRQVFLGHAGLLATARPGQVFVDHGVVYPDLIVEMAAMAAGRGATVLDCPVSGGPEGARTGSLVGMIGGPPESVHRASPFIFSYCSEIVHVGPSGKGQELKLINQLLVGGYSAVIAEAWDAVQASGIDNDLALRALSSGWGNSTLLQRNFRLAAAGTVKGTGATIGAFMHGLKDLATYVESHSLHTSVTDAVCKAFDAAECGGRSDYDLWALSQTTAS